ncbi:hypothetical protein BASA81_001287 [Batrachochytrium salamandrivorans]|nr:hypothetical protein BASA81_001287 [Batrachochytrium salamandrivorans]
MKVTSLTYVLMGAFSFAILFSYYCFVVWYGFAALPIPTVSETWLYKPANFVSRQLVIAGSLGLGVVHTAIYLATRTVNEPASAALWAIGISSAFCLGMLGGVCMGDDTPDCLGSNKWHDDFAVTYFILIDLWMCGMQVLFPNNAMRAVIVGVGLVCATVQELSPNSLLGLPSATGTVEWVNTLMVFSFMISFTNEKLNSVNIGVVDSTTQTLIQCSNEFLTFTTAFVFCSATALGMYLYPVPHHINGALFLPSVSDVFVLPPGNSIGRLMGVFGSCVGAMVMLQFYCVYRTWFDTERQAKGVCLVSVLAMLCLSLASCISKMEDSMLHLGVAGGFFGLFQVFTLNVHSTERTRLLTYLSLATKTRLYVLNMQMFNVLELVDLAAMLLFVKVFADENAKILAQHPLALYYSQQDQV